MRFVPSRVCLMVTAILLPLALIAVTRVELEWVLPAGFVVLIVVGLADLYLSTEVLGELEVNFNPVTRLARNSEGRLDVHVRSHDGAPGLVLIGLALPVEFLVDEPVQHFDLSGEDASLWVLGWAITGRKRGLYPTPKVCIEAPSLFHLFRIRRSWDPGGEIRVYPNLRSERKQLANLFLNRGSIGSHTQRMVGQGREYEQLREYTAGDMMNDIHWKASAKRGELVTKTYQIERTQEIYLVIDHSRLSGLRTPREDRSVDDDYSETILERYVSAASILSMVAEREGDHFGFLSYGHKVTRFVKASSGRQHTYIVQDALFDLKTDPAPSDLSELFTFIRTRIRRRALLIFLTDLTDVAAADAFQSKVDMISGTHIVLVNTIQRQGIAPMYAKNATPESIADAIAGHVRWDAQRHLKKTLHSQGVDFGVLDDEKLSLSLVNQYLDVKRRQIL